MYDALIALPSANRAAVTISMISCVALSLNNELFKVTTNEKNCSINSFKILPLTALVGQENHISITNRASCRYIWYNGQLFCRLSEQVQRERRRISTNGVSAVQILKTWGYVKLCFRLPEPQLPSFSLLPYILPDAFVIAMVSYSVTMSMALIFAQKAHYEVNSNQELLAQASNFENLVIAIRIRSQLNSFTGHSS